VLRNWKGRFFIKCKNVGCSFGYDADNRGNPASRCAVCGTGRMHSSDTVRVCADCGAAGSARPAPERVQAEPARAEPARAEGLGVCPKCKKGQLAVRSGAYGTFVSCSERCGLTYSSDDQGVPAGGTCKACKGPVKKTQNGSLVCALCGAWQDEKKPAAPALAAAPALDARPPKPKAAQCPRCSRPLKEVFTKRQKWAYRCETCKAWYDA
jgi:uncharacterized Zn finger protein (UPF0148 family)